MNDDMVNIDFTGDILLHSGYNRIASEKGPDFVFEKVSDLMRDADWRVGNLECVLSSIGTPKAEKGCLRGDTRYINALKNMGFNVLSLANNHSFDFGFEAYKDMLSQLNNNDIQTVGAGRNLQESRKMLMIEIKNISFGFLAYSSRLTSGYNYASDLSPGVAPLDENNVVSDIERYKEQVDHVIILLHWGVEYSPYPTPDQKLTARKIIDAGARLVVGHHPRILQGMENYNGGSILYSLGNFCHTDVYWEGPSRTYQANLREADKEIAIAKVKFSKSEIVDINMIPLLLNESYQPEPAEGERAEQILEKVRERSESIMRPDFDKFWEGLILKKRIGNPIKIWWESGSLLDKCRDFRFSQIKTAWELISMFAKTKFSRDSSRWSILNPANDKKARPFCGEDE